MYHSPPPNTREKEDFEMTKKSRYYVRPDGLHEAIRTINGKRVAFRGKTAREVDRKILEYKERQEKGRTVKEVCDEWERAREPEIGEASRIGYGYRVKTLEDALGEKPVKEVKPIDLERLLLRMKERGQAAATISLQLTVLKQVFRWAVVHGDIDISPAAEVRLPRGAIRGQRGSLTAEQIKTVTEYRGEEWLLGLMLLYTGCRRGELMALRYEDIDRKAGTITIRRKVNYAYRPPRIEDHTKTDAGMRTIPLLSPVRRALPRDRLGLVFANADGSPFSQAQLDSRWARYLRGTGLQGPDGQKITPHWLRHTFATICYDAGVDVKSTSSFLGHADEKITMELYTHLTKSREAASAEKLEAYVKKETAEG